MNPSARFNAFVCAAGLLAACAAQAAVTATFDDLPTEQALDAGTGLPYANGNSLVYQGATWDSRFNVIGDAYRVNTNPAAPMPLFGIPHSGHYFVTNADGVSGLLIQTGQVLTGAWFGRNQYYGYSEGGADQVSIVALAGATPLLTLSFDLPESHPAEAEPLSFFDTGAFAGLHGITGYRIDRRELGTQAGNWVADDFQFQAAAVPEPGTVAMWAAGLLALCARGRRRSEPEIFSPVRSWPDRR